MVLAVYIAFIGALVSVQMQYLNDARFASLKSRTQATLFSMEQTELVVNNRYLYVDWTRGNCTTVGRLVLCGGGNSTIEIPLGYSGLSIHGERYLS